MTRLRRTYPNGNEEESELTVIPIYMTRTQNRSSDAQGQDIQASFRALFKTGTDIIESDSLIYNGVEISIKSFSPIIYNGKTYLIKVEFG